MGQTHFDFTGSTTVITGGASGIGLTCAELIARCGGDVVVSASRRPDKTAKALDRIREASQGRSNKLAAFPC
ncbi:MAG: SDR family NAD(P)-dependent oxidoreductase, partial [Betaproteobacteria bacterium]|nr:SDR family NAD(P)-dependent oxidoreductase [Betaproteobacteria bacterium]